eukprot:SAG22_NODE_75_length_22256_cov_45.062960_4_plen_52_part_00
MRIPRVRMRAAIIGPSLGSAAGRPLHGCKTDSDPLRPRLSMAVPSRSDRAG